MYTPRKEPMIVLARARREMTGSEDPNTPGSCLGVAGEEQDVSESTCQDSFLIDICKRIQITAR